MGKRELVVCLIPPETSSCGFVKHRDLCISAECAGLMCQLDSHAMSRTSGEATVGAGEGQ